LSQIVDAIQIVTESNRDLILPITGKLAFTLYRHGMGTCIRHSVTQVTRAMWWPMWHAILLNTTSFNSEK